MFILIHEIFKNEAAYTEFIEKTINAPNHFIVPDLFELVKSYRAHAHYRTCWKYNKDECRFPYGRHFTEKTIITKPHDSKFRNDENQEVLAERNALLRIVKSHIDNDLYRTEANVKDQTKDGLFSH